MNGYRWIGWLTAILLMLTLLGPATNGVWAQDEEEFPIESGVSALVEDEGAPDPADQEAVTEPESPPAPDGSTAPDPAAAPEETAAPPEDEAASDNGASPEAQADPAIAPAEASPVVAATDEEAETSGSVKLFVEDQYGDPVEGAGFRLRQQSPPADLGEQFTDQNGIIIFVGIDPSLTFLVNQTVVPAGYAGFPTDEVFTVTPADTADDFSPLDAVLYLGQEKLGEGELEAGKVTILKYYCTTSAPEFQRVVFDFFYFDLDSIAAASAESALECEPGAADFWIEPLDDGEGFATSTSTDGSVVISSLPPGDYLIRETYPLASADFPFEVLANGVTTVAVQNFYTLDEAGTGNLEIQKLFCPSDSTWTEFLVGNVSTAWVGCQPGPATFWVFPYFSGAPIEVPTDANGYALLGDVPEGTHFIVEAVSGEGTAFTIVAGETTSITVKNYFESDQVGELEVRKLFCVGDKTRTGIYVGEPGGWPATPDWVEHCWPGNARFQVWPYGDKAAAIDFSTGNDGIATLVLPVTTAQTGPHVIVELSSGASAEFDVLAGKTTVIKVVNTGTHEKPDGDDQKPPAGPADEGVKVEQLPSTGIRTTEGATSPLALLGGMAVVLALAAVRLRLAAC
jgi:hypothetical protein